MLTGECLMDYDILSPEKYPEIKENERREERKKKD